MASDIPGTPLSLGTTVFSVVDKQTKVGVYSLDLRAGEEVYFALDGLSSNNARFVLSAPGSTFFESGGFTELAKRYARSNAIQYTFAAPTSGTYYLKVESTSGWHSYSLTVTAR